MQRKTRDTGRLIVILSMKSVKLIEEEVWGRREQKNLPKFETRHANIKLQIFLSLYFSSLIHHRNVKKGETAEAEHIGK